MFINKRIIMWIMEDKKHIVCPVENSGSLDNFFRKMVHRPKRILGNYIKEGMTVLDFGCGPGVFVIPLASMVGKDGKVIAADLQQGMLDKVKKKSEAKGLNDRIILHKCPKESIGLTQKADFALAFYVVHELPDKNKFFSELHSILKKDGLFLMVEPKFHVSSKEFEETVRLAESQGFKKIKKKRIFISRAVLLKG